MYVSCLHYHYCRFFTEKALPAEYTDQCITVIYDFHVVVILQWFGELVNLF